MATPSAPGGYITDVGYVRQFCRELSPPLLRAAAALNGLALPRAEDFDYCELGCAYGDTTCTLAAAYPGSRFVGVDLNPEHIALARETARIGGLDNVTFLERDFVALRDEGLPELDYVVAHGVLSWVAPAVRRAAIELAAARLKPGGFFYASYNALPGWAGVEPLRRLIRDAAGADGSGIDRARRGVEAARRLCDKGALYFADNPAAGEMLQTIAKAGLTYVVHEYLQPSWYPLYFADVAAEMAASGLRFVGEVPLFRNLPELAIPPGLRASVEASADRTAFESAKDFAANQFFRGDVYVKGPARADPSGTAAYLDGTPFGTLVPAAEVAREVRFARRVVRYDGPLFDALVDVLSRGPASVRELAADARTASFGVEALREGVLRLLASEQVWPIRRERTGDVAARYNEAILGRPLSEKDPVVLSCPAAGTGLVVPSLHAMCLRLLTSVHPPARGAWLRAFADRQNLKLHVRERLVEDKDEQARILQEELARFEKSRLPKLLEASESSARADDRPRERLR